MTRPLFILALALGIALSASTSTATPELDACLFAFATARNRRPPIPGTMEFTDPAPFIAALERLKTLDHASETYHAELSHLLYEALGKPDIAGDPMFRLFLRQLFDQARKENPTFWTTARQTATEGAFKSTAEASDRNPTTRDVTLTDFSRRVPGDTLVRLNLILPEWRESKLINRFLSEILGTKALREAIAEAEQGKPEAFAKLVTTAVEKVAGLEGWGDHEKVLLTSRAGTDVLRDLADHFFRPKKPIGWNKLDYALKIDPHSHWAGALPARYYLALLKEAAGNPPNFYKTAVDAVFDNYFNRPGQKMLEGGIPLMLLLRTRGLLKSWFTEPTSSGVRPELKLKLSGREAALNTVKAEGTKNGDRADIARKQIARFRENVATGSLHWGLAEFKAELATALGKKYTELEMENAESYDAVLAILDGHFLKNRAVSGNATTLLPIILRAEERAIGIEVLVALRTVGAGAGDPYKLVAENLLTASNHLPFSLTYFTRNPMEQAFFGKGADAKARQEIFRRQLSKATMDHLIREGVEVFEVTMNGTQLKSENLDELQNFGQGKVLLRPLLGIDGQELAGLAPATEILLKKSLGDARVAGVDFAGPERGDEAPKKAEVEKSLGDLAKILGDTYSSRMDAAKKSVPIQAVPPLLMRIHIGEGFRNPGEALDPTFARERLSTTLEALKELIPKLPDGVVIRLAHVTHASPEHAKLMGELAKSGKFFVDAPILSNIVTKALPGSGDVKTSSTSSSYESHPLLNLLFNKVPTMLGSDGGGTMHFSLRENYRLAGLRLLDQFRNGKLKMELPDGRSLTYQELIDSKILSAEEAATRFSLKSLEDSAQVYRKTLKLP